MKKEKYFIIVPEQVISLGNINILPKNVRNTIENKVKSIYLFFFKEKKDKVIISWEQDEIYEIPEDLPCISFNLWDFLVGYYEDKDEMMEKVFFDLDNSKITIKFDKKWYTYIEKDNYWRFPNELEEVIIKKIESDKDREFLFNFNNFTYELDKDNILEKYGEES